MSDLAVLKWKRRVATEAAVRPARPIPPRQCTTTLCPLRRVYKMELMTCVSNALESEGTAISTIGY